MPVNKNADFVLDPIAFMKKYSVCPGNDIQQKLGDRAQMIPDAIGNDVDYLYSAMQGRDRVAWLDFVKLKRTDQSSQVFVAQSEGSVSVEGSSAVRAGAVKSYFLPWTAGGGIIRLKIPAMGSALFYNNIKYFFTATITGCSIFIKGTELEPEIFHAGGQTGQSDPKEAAKFWRDLMDDYGGPGVRHAEVNKTHYISDPKSKTKGLRPGTKNADKFLSWLKAEKAHKDLQLSQIFPWGCVMGVRGDDGKWTFYLQENATIFFASVTKAPFFSTKKDVVGTVRQASRPMVFRQIFPEGPKEAKYTPQLLKGLV